MLRIPRTARRRFSPLSDPHQNMNCFIVISVVVAALLVSACQTSDTVVHEHSKLGHSRPGVMKVGRYEHSHSGSVDSDGRFDRRAEGGYE